MPTSDTYAAPHWSVIKADNIVIAQGYCWCEGGNGPHRIGVIPGRAYPEWEYATTTGPRKRWDDIDVPPEGEGWELDPDRGHPGESWERFDYHEERYWRRPVPATSVAEGSPVS